MLKAFSISCLGFLNSKISREVKAEGSSHSLGNEFTSTSSHSVSHKALKTGESLEIPVPAVCN